MSASLIRVCNTSSWNTADHCISAKGSPAGCVEGLDGNPRYWSGTVTAGRLYPGPTVHAHDASNNTIAVEVRMLVSCIALLLGHELRCDRLLSLPEIAQLFNHVKRDRNEEDGE